MKILALVGSKRRKGNTHLLVNKVLSYLDEHFFDKEVLFIKDFDFEGCHGCNGCNESTKCVIDDDMQIIYQKMVEADLLILASPTYYYNITSDMKKLIDRFFCFNIFDKNDRSVWSSYNHLHGLKAAVTVSICEQQSKKDIGFTTKAMVKPLEDIGYNVIYKLEAIKAFHKGEVLTQEGVIKDAVECAIIIENYSNKNLTKTM